MGINPKDFAVTSNLIRKRLELSPGITVIPFGYEQQFNEHQLSKMSKKFDAGSLLIRTRPDFVVIDDFETYFVEAKQKTKNIEAIQLLYNKFYERMGIKVIYSFPELVICASMIPMEKIIVPDNYSGYFDENLKHLFEKEGSIEFEYKGRVTEGSGDAFVPIDVDDLKLLADELLTQENL